MGDIDGNPQRGGKVIVVDPRPHRAPPPAPTSGCRSRPAPMPRCCSRSCTRCSRRTWSSSATSTTHLDGVDRMREVAAEWSPERVAGGHRHRRRAHPRAGPRAGGAPSAPSCTAESACATRSSAAWPAGSSTWSTSSPGTSTPPAGSMFPRAAAWSVTVLPMPGLEDGAPKFGRWRTRVRGAQGGARAGAGVVPGGGDRDTGGGADQGADHGRGQPRAVDAGGPHARRGAADAGRMITVDNWLNETTRHADVILPGAFAARAAAPRRPDLNFAVGSIANYSPPVFPPEDRTGPRSGRS